MDRLSVALAISRGRRLYHGLPFVVFALDLRDPLGLHLAQVLSGLGDARDPEDVLRRADRRERAPVVVLPSSFPHLRKLWQLVEKAAERGQMAGCTPGDLAAVRFFARGAHGVREGVCVFLAADEERSVLRFPLRRPDGPTEPVKPQEPAAFWEAFGPIGDMVVESVNDEESLLLDDAPGPEAS
jgi:hypothetical protein